MHWILQKRAASSDKMCIRDSTMTVQGQPVCYYVADIYIKDITSLRCAISDSPDRDEWVTELEMCIRDSLHTVHTTPSPPAFR